MTKNDAPKYLSGKSDDPHDESAIWTTSDEQMNEQMRSDLHAVAIIFVAAGVIILLVLLGVFLWALS